MINFQVNIPIEPNLIVKGTDDYSCHMITTEYMLVNLGTYSIGPGGEEQVMGGGIYSIAVIKGKLCYWDNYSWNNLSDEVQQAYFDDIADKELLGEETSTNS